jgi:hypothetical protein
MRRRLNWSGQDRPNSRFESLPVETLARENGARAYHFA